MLLTSSEALGSPWNSKAQSPGSASSLLTPRFSQKIFSEKWLEAFLAGLFHYRSPN
jgi:hypothetical protein